MRVVLILLTVLMSGCAMKIKVSECQTIQLDGKMTSDSLCEYSPWNRWK